ncbi:MauE/DoxX family redox-associated membrane protein [Arenibacter sp. M-2]|uniref:MauE/DoxX family redox-associated membrane protein n=1 Tax=Arenibacter sp. M-2 TaxID=3053612 RepID=UPI0025700026|nr:MauE/DoxX family redox-associated membrane protein [Arenibacter sp. M-2]MDL5513247.1 MauE/DoxX family redox-associated membrane protein [Arenibacter sp. M-2]
MKWQQKHSTVILEAITLLLIILFTYAGLTKLMEGHLFYDNIRNSPVLGGKAMASLAAWVIPLSELTVAVLLVWRRTRMIGLYGALGLMLLFTGYTVAIVFFAPYRPCSCGGVISLLTWEQHLVFNLVLLLLAMMAISSSLKKNTMGQDPSRTMEPKKN